LLAITILASLILASSILMRKKEISNTYLVGNSINME
jgi:hypothetical protein